MRPPAPPPTAYEATASAGAGSQTVEQTEVGLAEGLAKTRAHPAVKAAGKVAKLGDQEPLYAAAGCLVLAGLLRRRKNLVIAGVRVGAKVALSDAGKSLIKRLVKRSRPRAVIDHQSYTRGLGGSQNKEEQSFPSGHMAATIAAARALTRVYPGLTPHAAVAVLALGATRVAQAAHWPSDVAAGALIGWAAEAASGTAVDWALDEANRP